MFPRACSSMVMGRIGRRKAIPGATGGEAIVAGEEKIMPIFFIRNDGQRTGRDAVGEYNNVDYQWDILSNR